MRKTAIIFTAIILILSFGSCGGNAVNKVTGADYPVTVYGEEIEKCPQKVICLSPAVTDVIIALGSDAQLIGVSDNCDNKRALKTFGSSAMPETDKIIASGAEIVISDGSIPDEDKKKITDSGKQVIITPTVTKYEDFSEFYKSVASIFSGYTTGKENADNTMKRIDKRVDAIKSKVSDAEAVSAVILLSDGVAAPKGTLADQMLSFAGGKNITGDRYAIDYADIIKADPDHIFCPADMVDESKADKNLAQLKAVKDGNITALSPFYFERYGENVALGLEIMASSLHPNLVRSPLK